MLDPLTGFQSSELTSTFTFSGTPRLPVCPSDWQPGKRAHVSLGNMVNKLLRGMGRDRSFTRFTWFNSSPGVTTEGSRRQRSASRPATSQPLINQSQQTPRDFDDLPLNVAQAPGKRASALLSPVRVYAVGMPQRKVA